MKSTETLFLLLMLMMRPGWASDGPKADLLAKELEKTKFSLVQDEVKQRKILGALYSINHKMKKIVGEKANLEQERLALDGNVRELAGKISDLEVKTKSQKELLRERLATMYKLGGQGWARLLLSSHNSAELDRHLKIMGIVAEKDLNLIKDYTDSRDELERRKQRLALRWAHLQKLRKKINAQEQALANENSVKTKILQNVRKSQVFAMMKLGEIRQKSRQIATQDESGLLDLLFQPSFFEQKGQLPQPVQGSLVQGFGLVKDEAHKVVLSHKGHFYAAPIGSPVQSVFQGRVAFAGSVPGFGQTLIVDHGDHYYSVYSYNKSLQVHEGDEVKQAQVVALSGQAGSEIGNGLYFEIRHFSEPSDPKLWMKGSTL